MFKLTPYINLMAFSVCGFSAYIVLPFLVDYLYARGMSASFIGFVMSLENIFQIPFSIVATKLLRTTSGSTVQIIGMIAYLFSNLGFMFTDYTHGLSMHFLVLTTRAFSGLGRSFTEVGSMQQLTLYSSDEFVLERYIRRIETCYGIGWSVAPIIGSLLYHKLGFIYVYICLICLNLLYVSLFYLDRRFFVSSNQNLQNKNVTISVALHNLKHVTILWIISVLINTCSFSGDPIITLFWTDEKLLSPTGCSILFSFYILLFTVFSIIVPMVADAGLSYNKILPISILTYLFAYVLLPIIADHVSFLGILLRGISEAGLLVSLRVLIYNTLLGIYADKTVASNNSFVLGSLAVSISTLCGNFIGVSLYFSIGFRSICYYVCIPIIWLCLFLYGVQIIVRNYGLCARTYASV